MNNQLLSGKYLFFGKNIYSGYSILWYNQYVSVFQKVKLNDFDDYKLINS